VIMKMMSRTSTTSHKGDHVDFRRAKSASILESCGNLSRFLESSRVGRPRNSKSNVFSTWAVNSRAKVSRRWARSRIFLAKK